MAELADKKSNFISGSVQEGVEILNSIDALRARLREGTVLNYGTILTDADFTGSNAHLTKQDLLDLFATISAIVALLEANNNAHYQNLYVLKP